MIRKKQFLPELSHIVEDGEFPVFVTVEGRMGCIFEFPVIDLEGQDAESQTSAIERILASLPDGVMVRIIQRAEQSFDVGFDSFRSDAVSQIGFVSRRMLLSIEKQAPDPISLRSFMQLVRGKKGALASEVEAFTQSLPRNDLGTFGLRALDTAKIATEFTPPRAAIRRGQNFIDFGGSVTGIVRVYKPGTKKIGEASLAVLLDQLPLPFEVSVTARKVSKHRTDFNLRSQLARNQILQDPTSAEREAATQKALSETSLHGATLCQVEWLATLTRRSEADLRTDLEKVRSILSSFGEAMIETIGAERSYVASRVGSPQHFTFLEEDIATPLFFPCFAYGENFRKQQLLPSPRALLLHRLDGSLHVYDHFSSNFLAYNALITGKTGSGKSVLANALSSALMEDPDIRMIKVDVGGSYRKECEAFGGRIVDFRLDAPSGVNPFGIFKSVSTSNEAIEIVAEFLSTLIREEGEKQIPKAMRAQVEENLKEYAVRLREAELNVIPAVDHFLMVAKDFPRKSLLSRWAAGGVFENALKEDTTSVSDSLNSLRYRYFNFENIQAAANRDFAEGVMAAVITMVNLEMLMLGDRSKDARGTRLVLFCDETKFFIERFSQFFLLTSANFRKFGHGLVLMLQNIKDALIQLPDGRIDSGLILNCPIRFLLQADTEADYLKKQFHFEDHHLRAVVTQPYRGRAYREVVLQDDTGTRVCLLYLSDTEYWCWNSTKEDQDKLSKLRAAVPELEVEEAIRCLAVAYGR